MKFDPPVNNEYAATIVRVPATFPLKGLDNLVGVNVFNSQILTQKDGVEEGELRVYFPAGTQLSDNYCSYNNLYRNAELNTGEEKGYLEDNRRVRAIKLKGNRSDALLMPLSSLGFITIDPSEFEEGDTFDHIGGIEICRKYLLPVKGAASSPGKSKLDVAFKRVDKTLFPEHLSTDNFWRNYHLLDIHREVIVTQKLHGTSIRIGNVPVRRQKGRLERFLNRWFPTADTTFDHVYGSRKVIKDVNNPNQNHFYSSDIWTEYGKRLDAMIPEGFIVYGELIGWLPDGGPIQSGYTYDVPKGEAHLYVYRVSVINAQGVLVDLPWDGVRQFCAERGLKHVPEFFRITPDLSVETTDLTLVEIVNGAMDMRFYDNWKSHGESSVPGQDQPVPLSDPKTVDEGVCIRQDAIVPTILKAKSPEFIQHEDKQQEADVESLGAAA